MPAVIPPNIIAGFDPWGNALLTFSVGVVGAHQVDPTTGNTVPSQETLQYLAAVRLTGPTGDRELGALQQEYKVSGRLLHPAVLDSRIADGDFAIAEIEGVKGRFELHYDLSQDKYARSDIRQSLQGVFRVVGGPN
jgi:hypothetical protein